VWMLIWLSEGSARQRHSFHSLNNSDRRRLEHSDNDGYCVCQHALRFHPSHTATVCLNCSIWSLRCSGWLSHFSGGRSLLQFSVLIHLTQTRLRDFPHCHQGNTMKNGVFWDVTPCGSCENRRFGGTWRLLHQGDKNR
jgi:hypothetical protein